MCLIIIKVKKGNEEFGPCWTNPVSGQTLTALAQDDALAQHSPA